MQFVRHLNACFARVNQGNETSKKAATVSFADTCTTEKVGCPTHNETDYDQHNPASPGNCKPSAFRLVYGNIKRCRKISAYVFHPNCEGAHEGKEEAETRLTPSNCAEATIADTAEVPNFRQALDVDQRRHVE
jgi:hypothetical protein